MADQDTKRAPQGQTSENPRSGQPPIGADIEQIDGDARDREMGRGTPPLGDLGRGHRTRTPPDGEQGISNRPDDAGTTDQESRTMDQDKNKGGGQQRGGQQSGGQQKGGQQGAGQQGGSQNKGRSENKGDGQGSGKGGDRNH